jgi:hypothetical protein
MMTLSTGSVLIKINGALILGRTPHATIKQDRRGFSGFFEGGGGVPFVSKSLNEGRLISPVSRCGNAASVVAAGPSRPTPNTLLDHPKLPRDDHIGTKDAVQCPAVTMNATTFS